MIAITIVSLLYAPLMMSRTNGVEGTHPSARSVGASTRETS